MKFQNIVRPDQATARVSKLGCQFQKKKKEEEEEEKLMKIVISRIQELKKADIEPILAIPF